MDNITLYISNSSHSAISDWKELVESMEALDGVTNDGIGQKGFSEAGIFAVEVAKTGLLTKLAETIGGWLIQDRRRHIKLKLGENEIELFDVSTDDQEKLIKWFQNQVKKTPKQ